MIFSANGTQLDPQKIAAFVNSTPPNTANEVRSLLGKASYNAQFIKAFATIIEPVRRLTCKDTPFKWPEEHQEAYEALKAALTDSPVMSYFCDISITVLRIKSHKFITIPQSFPSIKKTNYLLRHLTAHALSTASFSAEVTRSSCTIWQLFPWDVPPYATAPPQL